MFLFIELTLIMKRNVRYNYIEIVFNFAGDAFPFYPPTATIVRPRLRGLALAKIACMRLVLIFSDTKININYFLY